VVLGLFLVWWGYRRIGEANGQMSTSSWPDRSPWWGSCSFLLASSTLESMRFHRLVGHPAADGRAVLFGDSLSTPDTEHAFGFDGGTVFLLLAWGAGLSLFTGLSWIGLGGTDRRKCDWKALFGLGIEQMADPPGPNGRAWKRSANGRKSSARSASAPARRPRCASNPPLAVIEKSEREDEERQELLFRDIPDAQRPPLRLLDAVPEAAD
jgi:S-DNA-T family DNA segregation ATPase FtsK/SpoIIIE